MPLWIALLTLSSAAWGGPSTQDRALAEELFRSAKQLVGEGDYASACPKFAESQQLDPQLGTLLHLATCHEQQGKTATAWIEFTEAASVAASKKEARREAIARERAASLEKRLSRLRMIIQQPADEIEVRLDGKTIGAASLQIAIPVDPGEHRIDAGAPDRKAWSRWIEVKPGPATKTVTIPPLEQGSGAMPPRDPPGDVGEPAPASDGGAGSGQRAAGFVIGGIGVAAVIVGAVFGGLAASQASDADAHCQGSLCTQ